MGARDRRSAGAPGGRKAALARLILDTSILVRHERDGTAVRSLVAAADEGAIAAVTVAELLLGVELSPACRRSRRQAYVEAVLHTIPIEDYGLDVARAHASLLAATRRAGRPRSAHDLIIAATALARERTVVTVDASGFDGLPGVDVRATR